MKEKNNIQKQQITEKSISNLYDIDKKTCQAMCKKIGLQYEDGYEKRVIKQLLTSQVVDRDGDIVVVNGIQIDNFMKNPNVLFVHDSHKLPVGRSLGIVKEGKKMWGLTLFLDDRVDDSGMSERVFKFVKSGAMPGISIGFQAIDVYNPIEEHERKKLGLGKYGVVFKQTDLYEYSIVPIPANQDAVQSRRKQYIDCGLENSDVDFYIENYCTKDNISTLTKEQEMELSEKIKENSEKINSLIGVITNLNETLKAFNTNSEKENSVSHKKDELYNVDEKELNSMLNDVFKLN